MGNQISPLVLLPPSSLEAVAYPIFAAFVVNGNIALSVFVDWRLAILPPNITVPSIIRTYSHGLESGLPSKPVPEFGPPAPSGLWPIMFALSNLTISPNSADSSHVLDLPVFLSSNSILNFVRKF